LLFDLLLELRGGWLLGGGFLLAFFNCRLEGFLAEGFAFSGRLFSGLFNSLYDGFLLGCCLLDGLLGGSCLLGGFAFVSGLLFRGSLLSGLGAMLDAEVVGFV